MRCRRLTRLTRTRSQQRHAKAKPRRRRRRRRKHLQAQMSPKFPRGRQRTLRAKHPRDHPRDLRREIPKPRIHKQPSSGSHESLAHTTRQSWQPQRQVKAQRKPTSSQRKQFSWNSILFVDFCSISYVNAIGLFFSIGSHATDSCWPSDDLGCFFGAKHVLI